MLRTDHIGRIGEQQFRLTPFAPCRQQATGMIECRWLSTTTSMSSCSNLLRATNRSVRAGFLHAIALTHARIEERPDTGFNSTVLPSSGLASSARQASSMRLSSSGAAHFSHNARGALPNIAPPSRRCEFHE
ncbi:hypothetical protein VM57_08075 [Stenotrophomonas maltophilia]|uniref:Uncharacterized protein n=1 Tax=Stenotrophomonas maltophilia TaxID=40324 RepID=A0A0F5ZPY9_STEMA|nr:hypothetical protein VM57_08075 [Stenotrophomonas maltophilia]